MTTQKSESFGDLVDRLHNKIKNHMGWDDAKTNSWWLTENPHFGFITPNDFLLRRPDKIERIVDGLIEGGGP